MEVLAARLALSANNGAEGAHRELCGQRGSPFPPPDNHRDIKHRGKMARMADYRIAIIMHVRRLSWQRR
eukprot:2743009-Alexandrium_andersonii.AAC.1